jgi:hypothetical protein
MTIAERLTFKNLYRRTLHLIDKCRGLDFLTVIESEEVGHDPNIAFRSSPSGDQYLLKVLKDMKITSNDSIIDMGCGQGSAMRTMLKFPFAQVDGVELSEHIGHIAISNFNKLKVKRCTVYICDASTFQSYDRYNFFYFSNPFPSQIMTKVISDICQAVGASGKEIIVIYNNPTCHDIVVGQGGFHKIKEYPGNCGNKIYVYSNSGA